MVRPLKWEKFIMEEVKVIFGTPFFQTFESPPTVFEMKKTINGSLPSITVDDDEKKLRTFLTERTRGYILINSTKKLLPQYKTRIYQD